LPQLKSDFVNHDWKEFYGHMAGLVIAPCML